MQDKTCKALGANNAAVNRIPKSIEGVFPQDFVPQTPLPDTPSVSLFEESLRGRLEAFSLDAQAALEHSIQTDLITLQEQLELQQIQLRYLLNEIHLLHWLREVKS